MNINDIEYINCTGCSACYSKCPHKAIDMNYDREGFIYPYVDESKCTDCNVCIKVCPALNVKHIKPELQECFAVIGVDEIRAFSSSGGMFSIAAEYVLKHHGYICGAAFDENMHLMHTIIDNKKDLDKLRRSKYVESKIGDTFIHIKKLLDKNEYVLFSGTPCQVAGLHAYLGKTYDRLITLDLVCGGVPSQKVFDKYLKEVFPNMKVIDYSFRDKTKNWYPSGKVTTESEERLIDFTSDLYFKMFVPYKMTARKSCGICDYANLYRVGDITIGDFWGIKERKAYLDDDFGTSLVIINTSKGKALLDEMKYLMKICEQVPIEYSFNNTVLQPCRQHPSRDKFFKDFEQMTFQENCIDKMDSTNNIGILNCFNTNTNFGGLLTGFALYHFLSNVNDRKYNVQNLEFKMDVIKKESIELKKENPNVYSNGLNPYFEQFRNKYMSLTNERMYMRGLPYFNSQFTHFIVGSDQMFNGSLVKEWFASLLQFVQNDKNIISCASSFGNFELDNDELIHMYKSSFKRFNLLSLREPSGVEKCKKIGIQSAIRLIDPVFYIDKNVYKTIADTSINKKKYNTVCYSVGENFWKGIYEYAVNGQGKSQKEFQDIHRIDYHISVEEWLYSIMNCELLVTNSFHGVCFALIFGRNFISINSKESSDRVMSLLEELNISGHKFYSINEINMDMVYQNEIDYNTVSNKLIELSNYAKQTLISSIENYKCDENSIKEKSKWLHNLYEFYEKQYNDTVNKLKSPHHTISDEVKVKLNNDLLNYEAILKFINNN